MAVLLLAQKGLSVLLSLPHEARRWRQQQRERATHGALLHALSLFMAGRFLRARKSAELVLAHEAARHDSADPHAQHDGVLRVLAHVVAAESAHALQDQVLRQQHFEKALEQLGHVSGPQQQSLAEGIPLRAARWMLDDRDPAGSLEMLSQLPPAVTHRTAAMRIELKAARLAGQTAQALEMAQRLAKHGAFTPAAAHALVRSLVMERIARTQGQEALQDFWGQLPVAQSGQIEVAAAAALRWLELGGEPLRARQWLLPVWQSMLADTARPATLGEWQKIVPVLERALHETDSSDARAWLGRIEQAQQSRPHDAYLQYLAGRVYWRHRLWGKAQNLLSQAARRLPDVALQRQAWITLAQLAEQRADAAAAVQAWRQAALLG